MVRTNSLTDLATALAALPDRDLRGLRAALNGSSDFAPGVLAWQEHAVGWVIDRRANPRQIATRLAAIAI